MEKEKKFLGIEHLSLRSLIIGAIGSAFITAGSMYVALKLGMVPWPTVFAAIVSIGILRMFGKISKNEVNVAQSSMTAGAMIAAGLGFTVPGLWKTGLDMNMWTYFWIFLGISSVGLIMGLFLTWIWRTMLLKRENLPYPIGIATAETIESSSEGSKKTIILAATLVLSAAYTIARDWFMKIPSYINFKFLDKFNMSTGAYMSPLAAAIGYMIGPLYTLVLFIGAVFGYILLVPIGMKIGIFSSIDAAANVRQAIGLGLMVGAGLGIVLKFIIDIIKKRMGNKGGREVRPYKNIFKKSRIGLIVCAVSFVICVIAGLSPIVSILVLLGVFLTTLMASLITGQAGIDPLEIFGMLIMITVRAIVPSISIETALLVAGVVAITSGFVGDVMFDYKTGQILGTNPKAQLISQAVGGVVGVIVASFTIFVMINNYRSGVLRYTACTSSKFCIWNGSRQL